MDIEFRLQGKQELFLSSPADICIGGGAAGGGKTFALLVEPLRHYNKPKFNSVLLRRTYPEITKAGGVWDEATSIYPMLGGVPNTGRLDFKFPKSRVGFGHLTSEATLDDWKSSQVALLMFDQLETFSERMFFYMLSRNRSASGVKSYVRATANPEPNWLAEFISWWIAPDGYADMERAGKMRAFIREGNVVVWGDSKAELMELHPGCDPKTVTYVPFTIYDNPILLAKDPGYLASLKALPFVDRERLLGDPIRGGNWKIKPAAGKVFKRDWFEVVDMVPEGGQLVRYFDFAGTAKKYFKDDPDFTAGVLMLFARGDYFIIDLFNRQIAASATDRIVDDLIQKDAETAARAGRRYAARWENEPGSASLRDSANRTARLAGIDARGVAKTVDKMTAWQPLAAMAEAGHVKILRAAWNEVFINQMHGVPDLPHDDIADATAGAFTASIGIIKRQSAQSKQG